MQCIARGVQDLPITELELITVAFVALNFLMYILWWDKPLNVQGGASIQETKHGTDDIEATNSVGFGVHLKIHFPNFQPRMSEPREIFIARQRIRFQLFGKQHSDRRVSFILHESSHNS
ncbi:hypothetical protein F5148DRAFT_984709 [Russula earlei]|uniref:Uncharacterized protein n=1 Tax=Russula earlei TaxID=71964 RepID=A0ACC0U0P5_9AGAM|nr:hypothetical protein F5148DRAFT_984709 [Russula earlei]